MAIGESARPALRRNERWKIALKLAVGLAVLGIAVGVVLPRVVDYREVLDAIGALTWREWLIITLLAGARLVAEAYSYVAVLPGLSMFNATTAYLASTATASAIPGPSDVVVRFGMYRSWGFNARATTLAVLLSFLFTTFAKVCLPVFAAVTFLAVGRSNPQPETVGLISGAVAVAGVVTLALVVRSEAVARGLGYAANRAGAWLLQLFRKRMETDFVAKAVDFRAEAGRRIRARWHLATGAGFAIQFLMFSVLLASLRSVGISPDELRGIEIFAAFALVQVITSVPITPGSVGITEVAYVSLLTVQAGSGLAGAIVAGVLIYRLFTWIALIPLGGAAWLGWAHGAGRNGGGPRAPLPGQA